VAANVRRYFDLFFGVGLGDEGDDLGVSLLRQSRKGRAFGARSVLPPARIAPPALRS